MDLSNFTEKAGPLPVWVWAVVIGGGGYWYLTRKSAANAAASPTSTTSTTDTTGQTSNTGDLGYNAAELTAQYDQLNALGLNTSAINNATNQDVILNSSVQGATSAIKSATPVVTSPSKTQPVVSGYYMIPKVGYFKVDAGKLYAVSQTGLKTLQSRGIKFTPVPSTWAGLQLPRSGTIN